MKLEIGVSMDEGDPSDRWCPFPDEERITTVVTELFQEVWPDSVKYENVFISIQLVSKDTIKDLNRSYRGCDNVTDVLSFPMWEEDGVFCPPQDWKEITLGDVVICPDVVHKNAEERSVPYEHELALMVVHSVLHLLAWDHDTPEREKRMWALQEKYRDRLIKEV